MNLCIHRYLTKCLTNPQPPGLADFIRGTKTLYILSKKFNYKLLIDYNIHPIFKYFKFNENIYINELNNFTTKELLPPISYHEIYSELLNLFNSKQDLYLLTNSFHISQMTHHIDHDIDVINNSNNFIKEMLKPSDLLEELFINKINNINININNYIIIHIRIKDDCFFNENFNLDENFDSLVKEKIKTVIDNNCDKNILVLSNHGRYLQHLKNLFNNIYITSNLTIHLGSLDNDNMESKIQGTLIDLLFMTKSKEIYTISQYGGSGFSYEIAQIYNIPLK
jgi:hypothetical protein